jgi:hypothetical protein
VETRVGQLDKLTHRETLVISDKIDKKIDDVTKAVETRVDQLEQLMQCGQQGVVAQVTAEMHHMHAQLEAKYKQKQAETGELPATLSCLRGGRWKGGVS